MKILKFSSWECQEFTVHQNTDSVFSLVVGRMILSVFFVAFSLTLPLNAVLRLRFLLTFFWRMLDG